MDTYDVVLLGAGSGAEWIWSHLKGFSIAVVEENRVGGECPYVACVPSKAMLRSAHLRREMSRSKELGASGEEVDLGDPKAAFARAVERRDGIVNARDDSEALAGLQSFGAMLYRGKGTIAGPGRVRIVGSGGVEVTIGYRFLVLNTGSYPKVPPVPGLDSAPYWQSEDAMSSTELPETVVILGGGAIGCELADLYTAFGSTVTLVEVAPQLLPKEDPELARAMAISLSELGVSVRLEASIRLVKYVDGRFEVDMGDESNLSTDHFIVAAGRGPRVEGLGLESVGVDISGGVIEVDEFCRVKGSSDLFAIGDVTAVAPFTHGANYQAKVVVDFLRGHSQPADYRAIPRAIYTDPPAASVGMSEDEARKSGMSVLVASMDLAETGRGFTDGARPGMLKVVADEVKGVVVGGCALGPNADELISELALAIRAEVPIKLLGQLVHAFPTYSEAYEVPFREMLLKLQE